MEQSIAQKENEQRARRANSVDIWNRLWRTEGDDTWRAKALADVYDRVCSIVNKIAPVGVHGVSVVDVGGGIGILAKQIIDNCHLVKQSRWNMTVIDHSLDALALSQNKGLDVVQVDLETNDIGRIPTVDLYVSTECMEHLSANARQSVFEMVARESNVGGIFTVPNNCLGPGDGPGQEPQHTVMYNAMSFKRDLQQYFDDVRVEVHGPYLMGVCGRIAKKDFTLSATLPVRDEAADLEPVLASLRGFADQLVVGVDPRTKDNTWEIAELYADEVFALDRPMGPPPGHAPECCYECTKIYVDIPDGQAVENIPCKEDMGENGIHFSWARNQCIDRCTGDWIFMTEGHERVTHGIDTLLALDQAMPEGARVGMVLRTGQGQQWAFPWLFQNSPDLRFTRPTHNTLDFPNGTFLVRFPGIKTLHDRDHQRGQERAKQRKSQNRNALLDDWLSRQSESSLFYLGQEWRDIDPSKAIDRLEQFLAMSNNGSLRYQARLILAKEYMRLDNHKDALRVLHGCTADDWNRSDHFLWLGDVAFMQEDYEKAYQFYLYAATQIGAPPFTMWWIDLAYYGHLPAQRLAQTCGELGRGEEALEWCKKVVELLPEDAPPEAFTEAESNVTLIESALSARGA